MIGDAVRRAWSHTVMIVFDIGEHGRTVFCNWSEGRGELMWCEYMQHELIFVARGRHVRHCV